MAVQKRITKSGKKVFIARWRDPSGKEHSKSFAREREAKAHVQEMERDKRLRKYLPHEEESITVRELFDRWMNDRPLREGTLVQYRNVRDRQLGPFGDWPARTVLPADVNAWAEKLRTCRDWLDPEDKGVAEQTVRITLGWLKSAFVWGAEREFVGKNPVRVPRRRYEVEPDLIPTMEEIQRVIDAVEAGGVKYTQRKRKGKPPVECTYRPDLTTADMLRVTAHTGLRISELCGLLISEVDFDAGVIRVRMQLSRSNPKRRVELKSRHSRRDIPIVEELVPVLVRVIGGRDSGFLFENSGGRPIRSNITSAKVARAAEQVGAPLVHFHALRHHFGSSLLTEGVPVQDVARVMGHTPATLMRVYAHVVEGSRERVAAAISRSIGRGISAGSSRLRAVS